MQISRKDYDRMEVFAQRMQEVKNSNYVRNFKGIKFKQDLVTDHVYESTLADDESTNHLCALVRPYLLKSDENFYIKIIKIVGDLIDQLPLKRQQAYRANIEDIGNVLKKFQENKNSAFDTYLYGKYAKADVNKAKKIQAAPPIFAVEFHVTLIKITESVLRLANNYSELKTKYKFKITGSEKPLTRKYSIGL